MAAAILLTAGGLWAWGRWAEPRRVDSIRAHVEALIDQRGGGLGPSARSAGVGDALRRVDLQAVTKVEVQAGDHPVFGDGGASHQAILIAGDRAVLGLRIATKPYDTSAVQVLGAFEP